MYMGLGRTLRRLASAIRTAVPWSTAERNAGARTTVDSWETARRRVVQYPCKCRAFRAESLALQQEATTAAPSFKVACRVGEVIRTSVAARAKRTRPCQCQSRVSVQGSRRLRQVLRTTAPSSKAGFCAGD